VNDRSSTLDGLPVEVSSEPVVAWRTWALTGTRDGRDLLLRPVARRSRTWRPLHVIEARCRMSTWHTAPDVDCTCGLHGTRGLDLLRKTKSPAVLGRVALWGRIVEHDLGFRAQFAYPQRLSLICQFCFWIAGAHRASPEQVGWFPRGELMPLCDEHLGVARRNGATPRFLHPAGVVAQRLRDIYAVDVLAV
jgi:hypothetical protein